MKYLIALSAALSAITAVLVGYPGDIVPQGVILGLLVGDAGLGAFTLSLKASDA